MAVHVVTDSTADVTPETLREYGLGDALHIVPLTVHFGDTEYRDGVTLSTSEFYQILARSKEMPRTSQPSPAAFVDQYTRISKPGDTILSFHISSKLSGTYQSALLAARQLTDRQIEVIDTRTVSMALALIALEAAMGVEKGMTVDEMLARSREMIGAGHLYFLVDTLEYLQRNGRIGKAQAFVGGLMNVKPILTLDDGVVSPVDRVRGSAKARARLIDRLIQVAPADNVWLGAIIHAQAQREAESLRNSVQSAFPRCRLFLSELGPTVGTHAGPGTLGVILFAR